jgi:hypothetical protein
VQQSAEVIFMFKAIHKNVISEFLQKSCIFLFLFNKCTHLKPDDECFLFNGSLGQVAPSVPTLAGKKSLKLDTQTFIFEEKELFACLLQRTNLKRLARKVLLKVDLLLLSSLDQLLLIS